MKYWKCVVCHRLSTEKYIEIENRIENVIQC